MRSNETRTRLRSALLALTFATPVASQLAQAGGTPPLSTVLVASGLQSPVFVTHPPGDHERLFILQQGGKVRIIKHGRLLDAPFLTISPISSGGERGLLGLAFHPNYPDVNAFFVNYTDVNGDTVVARYSVSDNPDVAGPAGDVIYFLNQPALNHNGGWLAFGPDGYLYVALGDGGGQRDPNGLGQRTDELFGNILRIDVSGDDFPLDPQRDYAIPTDNPFVGTDGADEIWSFGLRNPWRNAFDSLTGDLYVADVGESVSEEINLQPASSTGGENYGWSCFEGNGCTSFGLCCAPTGTCACVQPDVVFPVHTYSHGGSPFRCSITGGEVYRGCAIPGLDGRYFFADFCSAQIWSFRYDNGVTDLIEHAADLAPGGGLSIQQISSFGTDAAGEIYVCDLGGEVYRIIADPPLTVRETSPAQNTIDARRPIPVDGFDPLNQLPIALAFNGIANCLTPADLSVAQDGGVLPPPIVADVTTKAGMVAFLYLSRPLEPRSWTIIWHHESWFELRLGTLPGDVDAGRTTSPLDVLALIDDLLTSGARRPTSSTDVNRSLSVDSADVLELLGLMNGSLEGTVYLGASLP